MVTIDDLWGIAAVLVIAEFVIGQLKGK